MNIVTIRASSLAELFDCPARWEAKHLKGMRSPRSAAAQLGTAVHAGTAAFDQAVLDGHPISADDAAGALVAAIHRPEEEVEWEDTKPNDAEAIAIKLHTRYCADIAPSQVYRGVEVLCQRLEIPELGLALTGTTDRVREVMVDDSPALGISDLKTGARAVGSDGRANTAGHAAQLGVYELLAEHAMEVPIAAPAQIIGLQTAKTTARIGTAEITNPRAALLGTDEQPGLLQHASKLIHSGIFFGNPKSMLCSSKYCPAYATCPFKG